MVLYLIMIILGLNFGFTMMPRPVVMIILIKVALGIDAQQLSMRTSVLHRIRSIKYGKTPLVIFKPSNSVKKSSGSNLARHARTTKYIVQDIG